MVWALHFAEVGGSKQFNLAMLLFKVNLKYLS